MQFTLGELWHSMGLFARMIALILAVMSVASLFVTGERLFAFRKAKKASIEFAGRMAGLLQQGGIDAAASAEAGPDPGYLGRVLDAGLQAYRTAPKGDTELIFESVSRALERQAQREVQSLKRGQGVLGTVSSTAPFVGLLGTVMGIVNSFQLMAASGSGGLGTVSAGIAEALVTTAFGLIVAIPAVMAFNYFTSYIDARSVDISESSNELLDLLAKHLGHKPAVQPAAVGGGMAAARVQAR
jgi:biopolymer transport protein ExbB/biopolymer transport protein TolQ